MIEPEAQVAEGPFGEFTGYSSDRSTNNLFRVETFLRRKDAILVSVAGGNSSEHLNLGRVPREAEMVEKLKQRFPSVTAVHYPASGTHFHAYVALNQTRPGEARQIMLGLLGWDAYLKTVIAVDGDVDITRDLTCFGPCPPISSRTRMSSSSKDCPATRSILRHPVSVRRPAWASTRPAGLIFTACSPGSTRPPSTALRRFSRDSAVLRLNSGAWR